MKVSELKKLVANLPDDMEVVVSGEDHSYNMVGRRSKVVRAEVVYSGKQIDYLGEYWPNSGLNLDEAENTVEVLWIDDGRY